MIAYVKRERKRKASTCFFAEMRFAFSRREIIEPSIMGETCTVAYVDIRISTHRSRGNRDKLGRDEAHEVGILFVLQPNVGNRKLTCFTMIYSYIYNETIISHIRLAERRILTIFIC